MSVPARQRDRISGQTQDIHKTDKCEKEALNLRAEMLWLQKQVEDQEALKSEIQRPDHDNSSLE